MVENSRETYTCFLMKMYENFETNVYTFISIDTYFFIQAETKTVSTLYCLISFATGDSLLCGHL